MHIIEEKIVSFNRKGILLFRFRFFCYDDERRGVDGGYGIQNRIHRGRHGDFSFSVAAG